MCVCSACMEATRPVSESVAVVGSRDLKRIDKHLEECDPQIPTQEDAGGC